MSSSSKRQTLTINSAVFKWLYNTSGCTKKEIAGRTSITADELSRYLNTDEDAVLTLEKIKELAKIYNRPITAFLIPKPPSEKIIPKDFRRIPENKEYTKSLHRIFIKANRDLRIFAEMAKNLDESYTPKLPEISINDNPFDTAENERKRLKIDEIIINKNADNAYKQWREILSSYAIPVFQYNMDKDGVRGFISRHGDSAAIIVNSADKPKGRIFTIFHEYAHLLLRTESVCTDDGEDSPNDEINKIEKWCDNFAGAFLMPEKIITGSKKIISLINKKEYAKAAETLAGEAAVSNAAALIRLRVCNFIPPNAASDELSKWTSDADKNKIGIKTESEDDDNDGDEENTDKNKKSKGLDAALLRVSEVGSSYIKLADRNYENGNISYSTFLENIGITKVSHERLIKKEVMD